MLPRDDYIRVTGDESLTMLIQVTPTIVMYVGTREKALGQCKLSVVRKGVKHRITFNVLQGKYTPIFSLDASDRGHGITENQRLRSIGLRVHSQRVEQTNRNQRER